MNRANLLLLLACLLGLNNAWALSSDKEQPIHIEANRVDIDERSGISTYSGQVTLTQGSLRLNAETVTVYSENRQLRRVVALGQPAHFQQRPDNQPEDVHASAKQVEFDAASGILVFIGEAEFFQGQNRFRGSRIEYDSRQESVHASSPAEGSERIQVIIQPERLKQTR